MLLVYKIKENLLGFTSRVDMLKAILKQIGLFAQNSTFNDGKFYAKGLFII